MTHESRETLYKASGRLEGLATSENLTDAETRLILDVSDMIDTVLDKEKAE